MKRFLLGLLASSILMTIVVLAASLNMYVETDVSQADNAKPETQEAIKRSTHLETNASYTEYLNKGDTLFKEAFFDAAAIQYRAAIDHNPELPYAYTRLGEARYAQAMYPEAEKAYQKAIDLGSTDIKADIGLGKTYLKLKQFEAALNRFNAIEEDNTIAHYYRGILNAFHENHEQAQVELQTVIDHGDEPTYSQYAQNLLSSYAENNLAQEPSPAYLKVLLGRSLAENQENDLAIALIYDVLRDEPNYRDAWIILGYAYLSEEQFSDAQEALFKAIELDPTKAETRYFLGLSYFGLDDYTSAVTQIKLALQSGFEPQVQAYQKLGDAAVLAHDYTSAEEAYENVLVLNDSNIDLFVRPVWLNLDQLNHPQKALDIAEQAVRTHPDDAMSYNLLGWAQFRNNQIDASHKSLLYAITLNPDLPAAHFNLGQWQEHEGDLESAKASYKKAYDLDPNGSMGGPASEAYNRLTEVSNPQP